MNLQQYSTKHQILSLEHYSDSWIWNAPIEKIKLPLWNFVYSRICQREGVRIANAFFKDMNNALEEQYFLDFSREIDLLKFPLRRVERSVMETIAELENLPHNERCLAVFCIAQSIPLKMGISLTVRELRLKKFSPIAKSALQARIPVLLSTYVFSKIGKSGKPVPLIFSEVKILRTLKIDQEKLSVIAKTIAANKSNQVELLKTISRTL